VRRSPLQMFVATVRLQTGRAEYFQTGAAASVVPGVNRIDSREELMNALWASSCEPVLTPPVAVYPGRSRAQYVDGGVCHYFPARIAIDHGADEIYAIILRPPSREVEERAYEDVLSILRRTLDLLSAEVGDNNMAMTTLYTNAVRYLAAVREGLRDRFALSEEELAAIFAPDGIGNPFANKRAARLVVIRPDERLAVPGAGEFDPSAMAVMLQKGRAQARKVLGVA
jgi:NTE family protein